MKTKFKDYLNENIYYRGITTKTDDLEFGWFTTNKKLAEQYSDMNFLIYGGEKILIKKDIELVDLLDYDMDEMFNENDMNYFLTDLNLEFDVIELFDIMEDEIPLSRLINNILNEIVIGSDGFKILESGSETIYINSRLLKKEII